MAEQLNYNSVYQNIAGLLDSYGSIKDVVDSIYSSLPPENYGYEGEEYESEESVIEENDVRENAVKKGSELEIDFADEQELQEALEEENTDQDKFFQRIKNWAEIIYKLKDGIQAIITENTNYYYKVRFMDENGVEREGYVAKKNLRVIEEEEGETEQEDEKN